MKRRILIEVDCEPGEEYLRLSEISEEEFRTIEPLINCIMENGGYYPTGDFVRGYLPESIYQHQEIQDLFEKFLPMPKQGFSNILNIEII